MTPTPYPTFPELNDTSITPDGAAYIAKLKRSGRPQDLVTAYLLLLLATVKHKDFLAHGPGLILRGEVVALAGAIGRYVALQLHTPYSAPNTARVARQLEDHIVSYARSAHAGLHDDPSMLVNRLTLIVVAETQLATIAATRAAVEDAHLTHLTRSTNSADPCATCSALAGDYTAPFPADLYWSHPRCACSWSA